VAGEPRCPRTFRARVRAGARASDHVPQSRRPTRELFEHEYERALEHLTTSPKAGDRYGMVRGKLIRRWLMKRTECHIYYWYSEEFDLIEIRAFWGAKRGRGPEL
jgi:hypothetical protein